MAALSPPADDETLATKAAGGDQEAFRRLYDAYFPRIYDFALRTMRDQAAAADVTQVTFLKAWQGLPRWRGGHFAAWLFAIARNAALDEFRRTRHEVRLYDEEADDGMNRAAAIFTVPDSDRAADPEAALRDRELAELVWQAASSLDAGNYTLLDLHLRQGLEADALAEALGIRKGTLYTRLTRLRDALGDSVVALLLARRARDCPELHHLLGDRSRASLTPQERSIVQRHIQACDRCRERRRTLVSPAALAELFAGFAPVAPPAGLGDRIWSRVSAEPAPLEPHRLERVAPRARFAFLGGLGLTGIAVLLAALVLLGRNGAPAVPPPRDPSDIHALSHQAGIPSREPVIRIAWTPVAGALAYSILWNHAPESLPDDVADLPGSARGTESPRLEPGAWWFHLRTQGPERRWTSTVHLGPFVIEAADADPADPTPTPSVAPASMASPTPTPEEAPGATPAESVSPPSPTATQTPSPTSPSAPPSPTATGTPIPPTATSTSTPIAMPSPSPTPTPAPTVIEPEPTAAPPQH